ncbi:MAG: DUF366 family protein [Pseudomonadota bacterium]
MIVEFLKDEITYDGTQLRSHWISDQTGKFGDAIVSFVGPADVDLSHMVDLEDVKNKEPISSNSMLHFIVEHFDLDLEKTILRQRLLVSIIHQALLNSSKTNIRRTGDDLYDDDAKLSVSIATLSMVSTLIHTAINIDSKNTPVKTKGLNDYKISPLAFALDVMKAYSHELESIKVARAKVRGVK